MKRPAVLEESIPYISKMAIGNAGMECRNSKRVPPFSPHLFRKGKKNQQKLKTTEKRRTPENSLKGRNDGRLMPGARRRPPYSSGRRPCRHRTHWARWAYWRHRGSLWWNNLIASTPQASNLSSVVWCLTSGEAPCHFERSEAKSRNLSATCCPAPTASQYST